MVDDGGGLTVVDVRDFSEEEYLGFLALFPGAVSYCRYVALVRRLRAAGRRAGWRMVRSRTGMSEYYAKKVVRSSVRRDGG